MAPGVLDLPFLSVTHPVFDLGEGLLDRIEIGGVFRQEDEPGACGLDGLSNGLPLVTAEIVEDDDIARFRGGHVHLSHVGAEADAVDRAVDDARGDELIAAQRRQEGQGAPTPERREALERPPLDAPTPQRGYVGTDSCFVDEHQPAGIEAMLRRLPALALPGNVRPAPLSGEQRFCEPQAFAAQELPDRIVRDDHAPVRQLLLEAMQRDMRGHFDPRLKECAMRLQNPAPMPAHLARRHTAGPAIALRPLHHAGHRHPNPPGNRPARLTVLSNRRHNTLA